MKTRLSLLALLFTFSFLLSPSFGQVPQGFNYQAVARDGTTKNILPNTTLQVMLYIQSSPTGGTIFWKELHNPVTTNDFGMFTVVLGTGVKQTGSTVATFDLIDWKVIPKYVKTEIYYSGSWKDMGNAAQLWTVPYAMAAQTIGAGKLNIKGTATNPDSVLFEVKNKSGQTVFAVYSEGVRIYVDDGAKGSRGGFAVGGFGTDKATSQPYLRIYRDSTRIYVNNNVGKGQRGGFAVGGFDATKASTVTLYTSLTPENYFIGHESGLKTDPKAGGLYNSFFGYQTGRSNVSGTSNVLLGYQSGMANTASNNVFIGYQSGLRNTSGLSNIFIGYTTGYYNTTGNYNVYIGQYAGHGASSGTVSASNNVFLGPYAGAAVSSGGTNVIIGFQSARNLAIGKGNVFLGYRAGYFNDTASFNVFLGKESGYNNKGTFNNFLGYKSGGYNTSGSRNIFIGYQAGVSNTIGSSNVFLGNVAGFSNVVGNKNIFIGDSAGFKNYGSDNIPSYPYRGNSNVFIGDNSGKENYTGYHNVFLGNYAGYNNTTGSNMVFIGYEAGKENTTGSRNVFVGLSSGKSNTTGNYNTYIGMLTGNYGTTASSNVFMGDGAGFRITEGSANVFLGMSCGSYTTTGGGNIGIGYSAGSSVTTGSYNTLVGYNAQVTNGAFTNATAIGYGASVNASNKVVIGNSSATTVGGYGAWSNYSDARLKENIVYNNDLGLDFILNLKTVSYNYKEDVNKRRRDGLIAQDVQETLKDLKVDFSGLIIDDDDMKTMNLSYSEFIVPLINALQEQQKMINELKAEIEELKKK